MDPKILREAALAYQAVYDEDLRQEIEEQQDFENWVNSLVEEGYDLSECTWEEMYEAYLDEAVRPSRGGAADPYGASGGAAGSKPTPYIPAALSSLGRAMFGGGSARPSRGGAADPYGASGAARPAARPAPAANRPAGGSRPAPAARPSGGSRPAPSARPSAAPAARPASTTAARPASSAPTAKPAPTSTAAVKPAPGTKAAGPESIKPKTPNPLMQKTFGYQTGNAPDQQKARADAIVKSGAVAALKPAATPTTPTTQKRPMGSVKPGSLVSSFDMFDIVKGYLIDEGYADTEDAAISIMASMSENWKTAIIAEARAEGVKPYRPQNVKPLPDAKPLSGEKGDRSGYGVDKKFTQDTDRSSFKPGVDVPKVKKFGRIFKNIPHGIGAHANRTVSANTTVRGEDPGAPRSKKIAKGKKDGERSVSREVIRHSKEDQKESLELYNYILSHLLDEGYASDVETAEGIIENMSDEWIMSILG